MRQIVKNIKNNTKSRSLLHMAIIGTMAFAILASMIPSMLTANALELIAGPGGDAGRGGNSGLTGDANSRDTGTGGGGGGADGGNQNSADLGILDETMRLLPSADPSTESLAADNGNGGGAGNGGNANGGNSGDSTGGTTGDSGNGGYGGDGGDGGHAIAICNTFGCL